MSARGFTATADGPSAPSKRRAVPIPCRHPWAVVGYACVDYCPDCGRIRVDGGAWWDPLEGVSE